MRQDTYFQTSNELIDTNQLTDQQLEGAAKFINSASIEQRGVFKFILQRCPLPGKHVHNICLRNSSGGADVIQVSPYDRRKKENLPQAQSKPTVQLTREQVKRIAKIQELKLNYSTVTMFDERPGKIYLVFSDEENFKHTLEALEKNSKFFEGDDYRIAGNPHTIEMLGDQKLLLDLLRAPATPHQVKHRRTHSTP